MRTPHAVAGIAALLLVAIPWRPQSLDAQSADTVRRWRRVAQLNASLTFGESEQRLAGARVGVSRADSSIEVNVDAQTLYGEARLRGEAPTVTQRHSIGSLAVDLRPFAVLSPFAFGSAETNFAKRLDARYSLGVGAKRTFVNTARAEASLSLALLDEHTVPASGSASRLTRWSARVRGRGAPTERLRLSHVTFWKPAFRAVNQYVVTSTSGLEYTATRRVGLTLTLENNYDSEAVRRGARVYHDGQFLAGIAANW